MHMHINYPRWGIIGIYTLLTMYSLATVHFVTQTSGLTDRETDENIKTTIAYHNVYDR